MSELDELQSRIGRWGNATFPQSTTRTILAHLKDEVKELDDADRIIPLATDAHGEEAADCLLLLLHFAHRRGFSLFDEAIKKAAKNETRTWETKRNERGYFKHVDATVPAQDQEWDGGDE